MIVLSAGNPSNWTGPTGNNTYLLRGAVPTLVDAGVGASAHLDALADALSGTALAQLLITHGHPDHASGAPALASRWPSVIIRRWQQPVSRVRSSSPDSRAGHPRGRRCSSLTDTPYARSSRLARRAPRSGTLATNFGLGTLADALIDGETIAAGDGALTVIHTPGHAPDHCCFFDPAGGDLFCGDLARIGGTIVIPATQGGDMAAYVGSLERVRSLRPRRLLPGHGPVIDRPDVIIDSYLRHRLERERQIVEALRAGDTTTTEMVARIYKGLPDDLVDAAEDSVLAHLIKMEREGEVSHGGDGWRRTADSR